MSPTLVQGLTSLDAQSDRTEQREGDLSHREVAGSLGQVSSGHRLEGGG